MIDEYLRLLGLPRSRPSVGYLRELHRAQVSRVPYTNIEIMLGRPGSVDPAESVARVLAGRGGYCFHLNGAFSALLRGLGFRVSLHRGYVERRNAGPAPDIALNHLALQVHDLVEEHSPDGVWLVDAGLGDAFHDPVPLRSGTYVQGPFQYELGPGMRGEAGWRLIHDPVGSFGACDIAAAAASIEDFAGAHRQLSTSPDSPFMRLFTAQRRTEHAVSAVRGCTLTTIDAAGPRLRHLDTFAQWREALADEIGLVADDLATLWPRVRAAHEVWLAGQSATDQPDPAAPYVDVGLSHRL